MVTRAIPPPKAPQRAIYLENVGPGDGLQDQRRLDVAALEVVLGSALQLLDKGVQDHGAPPKPERQSRPPCLTSRECQNFATFVDAHFGARRIFWWESRHTCHSHCSMPRCQPIARPPTGRRVEDRTADGATRQ